jgi:delta14-sterol reductase
MSKATKPGYVAAPKTKHYEFGGPIGALGVTLAVPFFSYCEFRLAISKD